MIVLELFTLNNTLSICCFTECQFSFPESSTAHCAIVFLVCYWWWWSCCYCFCYCYSVTVTASANDNVNCFYQNSAITRWIISFILFLTCKSQIHLDTHTQIHSHTNTWQILTLKQTIKTPSISPRLSPFPFPFPFHPPFKLAVEQNFFCST